MVPARLAPPDEPMVRGRRVPAQPSDLGDGGVEAVEHLLGYFVKLSPHFGLRELSPAFVSASQALARDGAPHSR